MGILQAATNFRDEWREHWSEAEVFLSGALLADATFNEAAKRDLFGLVPIVAAASAVLLARPGRWLADRCSGGVSGGVSGDTGFAGVRWLGGDLRSRRETAISPLASMVLITASCVHVIVHHGRARADGQDRG